MQDQWEVLKVMFEILSMPPLWNQTPHQESVVLILPGKHQDYRITQGVRLWPERGKYLWVAGTIGTPDDPFYERDYVVNSCGEDSPDIVVARQARHTRDQMEWAVALLAEMPRVRHVTITTAAYHLPRCVLTFLAAMEKTGERILVSPVPLINPSGRSFLPEEVRSEAEKILEYQEKGDVLSFADFSSYQEWRFALSR